MQFPNGPHSIKPTISGAHQIQMREDTIRVNMTDVLYTRDCPKQLNEFRRLEIKHTNHVDYFLKTNVVFVMSSTISILAVIVQ